MPVGVTSGWLGRFRDRRALLLTVAVLILILALLSAGTWAVWTVTDSNPNNTFATNTVTINDNQGGQGGSAVSTGTAMFNVTNLEPGSAATTACIGVNVSGTAPIASLTLTAALGGSGQATLQNQLTMNVAQLNTSGTVGVTPGSNTNNGSCASYPAGGTNTTVGTPGATLQTWASASPYTIASPVTNTWYKFTVSGLPVGDSNCATYCNQTITVSLTWTLTTT
jgi:predicted ribosomally synthesized peptide with SipW-like signal peptide